MIDRIRYTTPDELPDTLPVFPLPGALLLPGGHLPLNIFEPRYLNMIEDALGAGRLIGMIQPFAEHDERQIPDGTRLYNIGCAGRIVQFTETDDGRYVIALEGVARFNALAEIDMKDGYRRVRPDFSPYLDDFDLSDTDEVLPNREAFLNAMSRYFDNNGISADVEELSDAPDVVLVTSLSMSCPLAPNEKQALLECENTYERGQLLTNLFEIAAHGDVTSPAGLRQ